VAEAGVRSKGIVSAVDANEDEKSNELEKGVVERPETGVRGPKLDEA